MGSAHAVFAPPGFGTPRESIHRSLTCASAVQPLDQPFRHSSIPKATSPLGAVHGLGPCRFRSPRVWYAPGINPPISRLRFGCPTSGPTIPFSHGTPRPVNCPRCGSAGGPPCPRATILRVFILVPGHQLPGGGGVGGRVGGIGSLAGGVGAARNPLLSHAYLQGVCGGMGLQRYECDNSDILSLLGRKS